jgi:TRAP-type C4-dicarboxylate transport system substrate-binding protein
MPTTLTRRSFVAGAALGSVAVFARSLRAAEYTFTQFHNQTVTSSLHQRLVEMWAAIRTETRGRVETQVFAQNNRLAGSDPAALKMLVAGEIQFFTLMGGILGTVVPVTSHMWSGFNLLAHLPTWKRLPGDITSVIERNATKYVRLQRRDQEQMNARLRTELARRGLLFNDVDPRPFRSKLSGVYGEWKERLGTRCWSLLEATTGSLA